MHNGHRNYTEWKKSDPDSYWAFIKAREKSLKPDIDGSFAKLISEIKIPENETPFNAMIRRKVTGQETLWDKMCEKVVNHGKNPFLLEVFDRFIDEKSTKKDLKKIDRVNKGLHPDTNFVRFIRWIKKIFCFWNWFKK